MAAEPGRGMEAWVTLHRAHSRTLLELSRRMEAERGVSVLEHGALYEVLTAAARRLRMGELAERLGTSPSATTRLVDRLVARGWIQRNAPPENRRTIVVSITGDGRRAYVRNNPPFMAAVEDALADRLHEGEMTQLVKLLNKLCR